jgi:hypothetical protein
MEWELDHVFVATSDPRCEAVASAFGMTFTERRAHRGQGTTNVCALFENAFFELLFASKSDELESDVVRPLGLNERIHWQQTGACPFGICFRPTAPLLDGVKLPFETWSYRPAYVPAGSSIPIVTPRGNLFEPLVFLMNRPRPPSMALDGVLHRGSKRTLTAVTLQSPHNVQSSAVRWFIDNGLLRLAHGTNYLMSLVLDGGRAGKVEPLAAPVPLAVSW